MLEFSNVGYASVESVSDIFYLSLSIERALV